MKRFITVIVILILTVANLYSQDKQFYFIGKYGRLGSISQQASNQNGIYLRWDTIEGDFPRSISRIKLIREDDNKTLLDVGSSDVMSANEIAKIFQSNSSQRRLFEIINAISKNDNPNCTNANLANIGQKVQSCLRDNYWAFLASRVNFDIARARYRAYLDTSYDKSKSYISYKLIGIEGSDTIILGKTKVSTQNPKSVLGAKDFKQIIESKCNDNRYGLDDYRVGLSWKNGGKNATEFFANGLMVSGYDIYYSTKPISKLPNSFNPDNIDIANIASQIPHDSIGELDANILAQYHLAKANETPITLGEKDTDGKKPIYLESMETLKKRGFKPNEKRYYFLVPRDFTGNYGKSVYIEVVIPDLLKPAKPINPRVIENNHKAMLIWDSVTPVNYLDYHKEMKACPNRVGNRITFVEKDKDCKNGVGITLNFNIDRYLVYRFENNKEATSFEDKNLNGIDDIKEELNVTTCKPKKILPSINSRLVKTIPYSNDKNIKFLDKGVNEGQEYWYKIVSVTDSNITSQSTMPIRAFVPKRVLINAPEFNVTSQKFTVKEISNNEDNEVNFFIKNDINKSIKVTMEYNSEVFKFDIIPNSMLLLPNDIRNKIFSTNKGIVHFTFSDKNNHILGTHYIKSDAMFNFIPISKNNQYQIDRVKKRLLLSMKEVTVEDGGYANGSCVSIKMKQAYFDKFIKNKKTCVEISLAMGEKRYKVDKYCDNLKVHKFCAKKSSNELYPLAVTMHYDNGLMSYPKFFSFVPNRGNLPAPNKPALDNFKVNKALKQFSVSIKPQIDKVTGTMLNLYNKDRSISKTKMVTHIGKHNPNKLINAEINVSKITIPDTWCIKGKSIGVDGQVSKWSTPLCKDLTLSNEVQQEDLLAWPKLTNSVVRGKDFNISFEDNKTKIKLLETVRKDKSDVCSYFDDMGSNLNFVVYRSTVLPNGEHSKLLQVSPLIDKPINCDKNDVFKSNDNLAIENIRENEVRINFVDKYPYIAGEKFQYVLLFFDKNGEISSYSLTSPAFIQTY